MSDCPSCGRYVGPYDACPHCGAALSGRTSVRRLKAMALTLAVGGLALLWLLTTRTDVPTVPIGQVNALMNLAYVRVQGQVVRPPTYDPAEGYFSFWLQDDTGELYVAAYREASQALLALGQVPALGDQVTVEGTLRVREDHASLTLNVPERLQVQRATPVTRPIGAITAADVFQRVRVRAQVRALRVPYPGLTLIRLRDETGEIELAVSEVITALGEGLPALSPGQTVQVIAPVALYKEQPQLCLACDADLTIQATSLEIAPTTCIGQLDTAHVGRWVKVEGEVTKVAFFSAGVKSILDDGTGQITLLLWQDLYETLAQPEALVPGARLCVQGQVNQYQGTLEIMPELPIDIQITSPRVNAPPPTTAPPTAAPTTTAIPASPNTATPALQPTRISIAKPTATLTPRPTVPPTKAPTPTTVSVPIADVQDSTHVTISGRIVETASFAQGFKFTLDDGSGRLVLLMWHEIYDDCWDAPQLNLGATVRASGRVGRFEGQLQIEPRWGGDVKVTAPGDWSTPSQPIGSLGSQLGNRVTITGQVIRTEGAGDNTKIFVGDDTGEIVVFIWGNVLARVPHNQALGIAGTPVRVTGVVQTYRSNLELVPLLPYDVVVLE